MRTLFVAILCLCTITAAGALADVIPGPPPHQRDENWGNIEIKVHPLGSTVAMLEGSGGNIGVFYGDDGVVIIDDEFAPLHAKIKAAIATMLSKKPLRFVINTHWHNDHTGGNEPMGQEGVVIVAHDNTFLRLSTQQTHPLTGEGIPAQPTKALPVITFDHEVTFHLNGDTVHVVHVEHAHTDSDAVVIFERANVVHMGDTFFPGVYPFIDASTGGGIDGVIAAAERVLPLMNDATQVIPGHGPVANKAKLIEYRTMLKTARDKVAKLKKQKKTLQQVIAAKPTAELDAAWGGGSIKPDAFVKTIYETLK